MRSQIKRDVAEIMEAFGGALEAAGPTVRVLRFKKPSPARQTIHNIAKEEWEKQPRKPRIEWVDTSIN